MEINKCLYCGHVPRITEVTDLFYVQCKCGHYNPHQFVGITKKNAVAQWNFENAIRVPNNPTPKLPCARKDTSYYKYYLNGVEAKLDAIAKYIEAPPKYIRNRFIHYGVKSGSITIKKITIERKEYKRVYLPEK